MVSYNVKIKKLEEPAQKKQKTEVGSAAKPVAVVKKEVATTAKKEAATNANKKPGEANKKDDHKGKLKRQIDEDEDDEDDDGTLSL